MGRAAHRKRRVGAEPAGRGVAARAVEAVPELAGQALAAAPDMAQQAAGVAQQAAQQAAGVAGHAVQQAAEAAGQAAQKMPERARALRTAASQIDLSWARSWPAAFFRENFMALVMNPLMNHYAARRASGFEKLSQIEGPVILVANHSSHMDTPVILSALPRALRKRTAVAAAADYFYRKKWVGLIFSLLFNTVPIERGGGGRGQNGHLDKLLDDGWNLLMYPEGTRKHASNSLGRMRRGAAVLAAKHNLTIVPIRVEGTKAAMPPGQLWPKRLRAGLFRRRYPVEVSFGDPIAPLEDSKAMIALVQQYFEEREPGSHSGWLHSHSSAGE